jgi:tetratricopeptide (TPR) repeat protein
VNIGVRSLAEVLVQHKVRYGLIVGLMVVAWLGGFVSGSESKLISSDMWKGKDPGEVGDAFLKTALIQAGAGSWERIAVGRVHYLAGEKEIGQKLFDEYVGDQGETSDRLRIARVYVEAGEWEKAKPLLDRVVEESPKHAKRLAEVGAYYNLNGDREHAEDLFERSFAREPSELWNTVRAAASYKGVDPQMW